MITKGTQIVIDMYSCDKDVLSDKNKVKQLVEGGATTHAFEPKGIYFNDDDENNEYSYFVPCHRGHINVHVYPLLGFVALDIFTLLESATPQELAKALRKDFAPEKAKVTFLERGGFGSQYDMKPRRRNQVRAMYRAKRAGNIIFKQLVLKPKSL